MTETRWRPLPSDFIVSKLGARREKDLEFARSMAALGLVPRDELLRRLRAIAVSDEHRWLIADQISTLFA